MPGRNAGRRGGRGDQARNQQGQFIPARGGGEVVERQEGSHPPPQHGGPEEEEPVR